MNPKEMIISHDWDVLSSLRHAKDYAARSGLCLLGSFLTEPHNTHEHQIFALHL